METESPACINNRASCPFFVLLSLLSRRGRRGGGGSWRDDRNHL